MKKDIEVATMMFATNRQVVIFYRNTSDPECNGEACILTPHDYSEAEVRSIIRIALRNVGVDVDHPSGLLVVEDQYAAALDILTGDYLDADPAD
jgi:hypothetical protein